MSPEETKSARLEREIRDMYRTRDVMIAAGKMTLEDWEKAAEIVRDCSAAQNEGRK